MELQPQSASGTPLFSRHLFLRNVKRDMGLQYSSLASSIIAAPVRGSWPRCGRADENKRLTNGRNSNEPIQLKRCARTCPQGLEIASWCKGKGIPGMTTVKLVNLCHRPSAGLLWHHEERQMATTYQKGKGL